MKQRLALRLVLSHLLVILVVSGITSVVLLTQSRRYFVNADRRALLIQAKVAAKNCNETCLSGDTTTFDVSNSQIPPAAIVSQNRGNVEGNLSVSQDTNSQVAAQGRIQASLATDVRILRVGDQPFDAVSAAALEGRATSATIGRDVVAAAPVRLGGNVVGAIEVRSDLSNVEGVLGDLRRRILAAVAGGALLAALLGSLRARSIAKPLRELTVAARAVADGNFTGPLPVPKGHDEISVLTTTFGDMRDRVQHELEVRNAFVADASHELRTPLTAIRGAVEILQSGGAERPEVRDRFLLSLGNETNRLLGLVDGLLQLETNGQGFALNETIDVGVLINDVVEQMQPIADPKSVSFSVEVARSTDGSKLEVLVLGNAARLRQVFVNLIDNAINYSPMVSTVVVAITVDDQSVRNSVVVRIADAGPGIPEKDRERVLERFVRLDESRNRAQQNQDSQRPTGAGLGLSIARSIVQTHGGTLAFLEGPNGVGTTARIELPSV
jgi:signal transduction histidine kinase